VENGWEAVSKGKLSRSNNLDMKGREGKGSVRKGEGGGGEVFTILERRKRVERKKQLKEGI